VFFSMGFLRYDGAIYVCLLPIAALATLPLDRNRIAAALLLYLALHAAIAVLGGIGAATGWHSIFYHPADLVDHQPTFFGLFKAHNATASVYVFLAVGAFAWSLRSENTPRSQVVVLLLTATLAFGCILARSRGAYLAMGAGMAYLVVVALRRQIPRHLKIGATVALAVVIVVGTVMMVPRFVRAAGQGGDQDRKAFWGRAWSDFKRSPVVGIGFGRYNDLNPQFSSIGIGEVATKADVYSDDRHAHNSYLHWLAEGGALWVLILKDVQGSGALRDWVLSGIVALAVLSLTEHYAGGGVFLMHLAFLIGVNQSRRE
jgi:O-antigen ligase